MKLEKVTNEKNELEFYIDNERHTLPNLLKEKLSKDADVEFCAYKLDHPLEKKAKIIVKTKGKSAKKAVEDAIKEIQTELDDFKKAFEKTK